MIKKLIIRSNEVVLACAAWLAVMSSYMPALAGVEGKTAAEVSNKIVETLNNVLAPIGSMVVFVTIVIAAFKIITTANKPHERAEAMSSLPYIVGGGILLGGALLASGMIYKLMLDMGLTPTS